MRFQETSPGITSLYQLITFLTISVENLTLLDKKRSSEQTKALQSFKLGQHPVQAPAIVEYGSNPSLPPIRPGVIAE